jgi:sterol desaturase/sphingolipid hydroxylase (fatty acid hydroxylase superfamily)
MLTEIAPLMGFHELDWSWPAMPQGVLATVILLLAFGIFASLERYSPRVELSAALIRQSYKTNIGLLIFNSLVVSFLSATSLLMVAHQHFGPGLLDGITDSRIKAAFSFLAIDLLLYSWHKACHRFDGLWMFHKVHHNDPSLNVSTGFRVHIVELLATHLLKAAMVIVMGIDISVVLVNEVATTLFIMLHHSNISFLGEKWFGLLFNAPYLHRAHHSTQRDEHDSNYGAVLSIWDRIFGTLMEREPLAIGIKGSSPQNFVGLIKFGFTLQTPLAPQPVNLEPMIAEAAYYRAEKRSFYPGHALNDWLEAKKEIASMGF